MEEAEAAAPRRLVTNVCSAVASNPIQLPLAFLATLVTSCCASFAVADIVRRIPAPPPRSQCFAPLFELGGTAKLAAIDWLGHWLGQLLPVTCPLYRSRRSEHAEADHC